VGDVVRGSDPGRSSLIGVLLAACSSNHPRSPSLPAPTVDSSLTAPARVLSCVTGTPIDELPTGYSVVLGVVALPVAKHGTFALQTTPAGPDVGVAARLSAKARLIIKPGKPFEMVVPNKVAERPVDWLGWSLW
jgi:hypothetical protein